MTDYVNYPNAAYVSALVVTPNDGTDLVPPTGNPRPTRGVSCSGAGSAVVIMADGIQATITLPTGSIWPIAVKRVLATGTTATGITAFW